MNSLTNALVIGLITRPHGIKGEVCVQYYADSPFLLKAPIFIVSPDKEGEEKIIDVKTQSYKTNKDSLILKLENCYNRDDAELLRNYEICIDSKVMRDFLKKHTRSSQQNKDDEDVFVYQLIGVSVYTIQDEQEIFIGILEHVDFMPGQEMWRIVTNNKQEILFPAVPQFVHEIDIENKKIIINPPEGLLEIYLQSPSS